MGDTWHATPQSPIVRGVVPPAGKKASVRKARETINLYLIGASGVGKTTLLERFNNPSRENNRMSKSTIGVDLLRIPDYHVNVADKTGSTNIYAVDICMWDTGGDEMFRAPLTTALQRANLVIYVYDSSEDKPYKSCAAIQSYWHKIVRDTGLLDRPYIADAGDRRSPQPYFAMIGNKLDLLYATPQSAGVPTDVVDEVFETVVAVEKEKYPMDCTMYTSGYTGENVSEAFLHILRSYMHRESQCGRLQYEGDGHGADYDDGFDAVSPAHTGRGTIRVVHTKSHAAKDTSAPCCG